MLTVEVLHTQGTIGRGSNGVVVDVFMVENIAVSVDLE